MEPFFIFLAIIIFVLFRGAARGQRHLPGIDPYDGSRNETGETNERVLEAQERALEALQRWEARQGLGRLPDDAAPVRFDDRRGATRAAPVRRDRREAYAEIARLLEPKRTAARSIPRTSPDLRRQEADDRVPSAAAPAPVEPSHGMQRGAPAPVAGPAVLDSRSRPRSALARLESLPLAARAVVYAEILRPPRVR